MAKMIIARIEKCEDCLNYAGIDTYYRDCRHKDGPMDIENNKIIHEKCPLPDAVDLLSRRAVVDMLNKRNREEQDAVPDHRIGDGSIPTIGMVLDKIAALPNADE